jgi:hypothetical protein
MIEEKDGKLVCSCGAKADFKDRKRFHKRHSTGTCVARIAERKAVSKALAQGTRCVDEVCTCHWRQIQDCSPSQFCAQHGPEAYPELWHNGDYIGDRVPRA